MSCLEIGSKVIYEVWATSHVDDNYDDKCLLRTRNYDTAIECTVPIAYSKEVFEITTTVQLVYYEKRGENNGKH